MLLDHYHGEWGGDVSKVYDELRFLSSDPSHLRQGLYLTEASRFLLPQHPPDEAHFGTMPLRSIQDE